MFKVGDKIICTNPRPGSALVKNREYSVVRVWESYGQNLVSVKGEGMQFINSFNSSRFELAIPLTLENK